MIRNLIFDFGQVLVRFDPEIMLSPYFSDPADRETVLRAVFDRRYWDRLDDGSFTEEDAIAAIKPTLSPRLREPMEQAFLQWHRHLPPIDGMEEMIDRLRSEFDVSVYLLSNISRNFASHADDFSVLRKMDGCVFSGVIGLVKPSREIFTYTLRKFGLNPEECVFVDDRQSNIAGAESVGIHGYCFDGDVQKLEVYLRDLLKNRNI